MGEIFSCDYSECVVYYMIYFAGIVDSGGLCNNQYIYHGCKNERNL